MSDPVMFPAPGDRCVRFVGDRARFRLQIEGRPPTGWRALLRTDIGRAGVARDETIATLAGAPGFAGVSWRDVPMTPVENGWELELPLTEVGWFRAKAYCVDQQGRQRWPHGDNLGIAVHPDHCRSGNTIYCAFVRMFGETRHQRGTRIPLIEDQLAALDKHGYTVIPPSGKLRDLTNEIPHVVGRLGCRILHLLPVTPTPTTYARMGRFGSPYAAQDLTSIDPALVEFDRRTTGVDQFRELTYAAHLSGARVFLDVAINHTGWGSTLMERRPDWFRRKPDGSFQSPGAWGTIWEDLVELEHEDPKLWDELAQTFLVWCRRGVDGFRCDAGYMVPLPAWRYITARVRQEYPDTVFLLEGLGGAWSATEDLLTAGGMQWAYSELFQNHDPLAVSGYLDHAVRQSNRAGLLIHYSETHDNDRLAKRGRAWSLMRNRLCALASPGGGFGFTCGVEWLATEKLEVHQSRGLNWGADRNLIEDLGRLNRLVSDHPCFFADATITRLSPPDSPLLALRRDSHPDNGPRESVLVLVNLDPEHKHTLHLSAAQLHEMGSPSIDLLGQNSPAMIPLEHGDSSVGLGPCEAFCLAAQAQPVGLAGETWRSTRARSAFALQCLAACLPGEDMGPAPWTGLAELVERDPVTFLAACARIDPALARGGLLPALAAAAAAADLPQVCVVSARDLSRIVPVPPGHWLLVKDVAPFAATLHRAGDDTPARARSIPVADGHVAAFAPGGRAGAAGLTLERFSVAEGAQARMRLRFLAAAPEPRAHHVEQGLALLTNGRGAMARLHADLGRIASKYDCLLGANLHPDAPSDRHILAKRLRAWVDADGFITPLNAANLAEFSAGPPARWTFVANAGDGRTVELRLVIDLLEDRNAVVVRVERPESAPRWGDILPSDRRVSLTLRFDLEDRGFHNETARSGSADSHFRTHLRHDGHGFAFAPAADRRLAVRVDHGAFHAEPEWCEGIPHPVEASRGMTGQGDSYSPGWFEVPLAPGAQATVVLNADGGEIPAADIRRFAEARSARRDALVHRAHLPEHDGLGRRLAQALGAYVVRRGKGTTVVAGYPWFLDWGRDTLICARGMLAAGLQDEVLGILRTFGRFADQGTLPNMLNGDDAGNRDTCDAQLWYALAAEELAAVAGAKVLGETVAPGRTIADVLAIIANGYLDGTPNGIRVDPASALVWSPPHFTWMDTNHPACTPRTGYPIEIQALWIRLLRLLERTQVPASQHGPWWALADRAQASLERFWLEDRGWYADCLLAPHGESADRAVPDQALRPNQLFAIALGLSEPVRARRACAAAQRLLLVPGAMRSLAPIPVEPPLEIRSHDGRMLADPLRPYHGRYEGDEDTRRKPAYHNGTAWCWLLPTFCEAVDRAWEGAPAARAAARAWLGSVDDLLDEGCVGQLPEILDGDVPHTQRGCDAQAWSVSEALRVWIALRP